jgi:hypothetical protein
MTGPDYNEILMWKNKNKKHPQDNQKRTTNSKSRRLSSSIRESSNIARSVDIEISE